MINFEKFFLDNGLQVLVHEDSNTQVAVLNLIYDVGSKDEHEDKTGFAHLFEHLMFGGSKHIHSYDENLQRVGGQNNAFTSPDLTNYYLTVPAQNIETGFWLESDRMMGLSFDPKILEVQQKVVIEEFKQRYLNQPYGDFWLKLRPLAYKVHPYRWATIGKEISHIENATMDDVKEFFYQHYVPSNATLVVAGNVKLDKVKLLAEKWFGPIKMGAKKRRNLPVEPIQKEKRTLHVEADVPMNSIYKAYHVSGKFESQYCATDMFSDIMGRGKSSRLYDHLIRKEKMFNSASMYLSGAIDPGLVIVEGKLNNGVAFEEAESLIDEVLEDVKTNGITEQELERVKNKTEVSLSFGQVEVLNRAVNLAMASLSGEPERVNTVLEELHAVKLEDIKTIANAFVKDTNSSVLYYKGKH